MKKKSSSFFDKKKTYSTSRERKKVVVGAFQFCQYSRFDIPMRSFDLISMGAVLTWIWNLKTATNENKKNNNSTRQNHAFHAFSFESVQWSCTLKLRMSQRQGVEQQFRLANECLLYFSQFFFLLSHFAHNNKFSVIRCWPTPSLATQLHILYAWYSM